MVRCRRYIELTATMMIDDDIDNSPVSIYRFVRICVVSPINSQRLMIKVDTGGNLSTGERE